MAQPNVGRPRPFRHVPPVGVPLRLGDLGRGLAALLAPQAALDRFQAALAAATGSATCHLVSSGRAALALILAALKTVSDRHRVLLPAYGCPTTVQAVLAAGLEPVFCDVSPHSLDLDRAALARLAGPDLLAVVPVHLYGLAQDVGDLLALGEQTGFFVIEDAAQAFGARFGGQMVGTRGHAGLYSLGRGKNLPAGHGGVLVGRGEIAPTLDAAVRRLPPPPRRRGLGELALAAGYGLATRPAGWWFVVRSPLNPADEGMDLAALPPIRPRQLGAVAAGIGDAILVRLGGVQATARRYAETLVSELRDVTGLSWPQILPASEPVFLRLPVVAADRALADRLFDRLHRAGIGVSRSYRRTLPDLYAATLPAQRAAYPGADKLATDLLTLPVNAYLKPADLARVVDICRSI